MDLLFRSTASLFSWEFLVKRITLFELRSVELPLTSLS
jgi:hypothetical protein